MNSLRSPPLTSPAPSLVRQESSSLPARNPVGLRLYKVLGTKYDDASTQSALRTLSALYAPPASVPSSSTLSSAKAKDDWDASDSDSDDGDAPASARAPATAVARLPFLNDGVPGDIAARARRGLRRDVERRLADGSRAFLAAFADVDHTLDTLQAQVAEMRAKCGAAEEQLSSTNDACRALLERAGSLRAERADVATKQAVAASFLARFTLGEAESAVLSGRDGDAPLGPAFFAALDRAQQVRADAAVLMAGAEGPTQAGLDVMAATAAALEQAYEKLARYCSAQFRAMGLGRDRDAGAPDVPPVLREAVRRLGARPELLVEALTLLAQTRASALATAFSDALRGTSFAAGGASIRPIELHAHDALRYAGDMLAWVHGALAGERELAEALLLPSGARMRRDIGAARVFGAEESKEEEWMRELVDGAVGRICAPLKARILQTLRSQEPGVGQAQALQAYKLAQLLQFYAGTMRRTLGSDAALSTTLKELAEAAHAVFFDAIEAQGRALLRLTLDLADSDLAPPAPVLEHARVLRDILAVHASALEDAGDGAGDDDAAGFGRALDAAVDPALEMAVLAAEEKRRARPGWDAPVFILNSLSFLKGVLEEYPFAKEKTDVIEGLIQGRLAQLVEEHYDSVLHDAGLVEAIEAIDRNSDEPLSRQSETSPAALQRALARFAAWLSTPAVMHSPRLAPLSAHGLAARVHRAALARLARAYAGLCTAVRDPRARYEAAATLLGGERPFGQVEVLRQILGLEEGEEE